MNPMPDWFDKSWFNNKKDFVISKFEEKLPEAIKEFNKVKTNIVNSVMNKKKKHRRDPARPW
jgi:hypothetical protein